MVNVQDIRKGNVFKHENDLWTVMSMQHVQPGKGGALVKIRARSQRTGNSKEMTFRSGEKIDTVNIFEQSVTYSYKDHDKYVFMDNKTYEQYFVDADLCEDIEKYVVLNGELSVNLLDNSVLSVNIPNFVTLKVTHAEPGLKGDTATKATDSQPIDSAVWG